MTTQDPPGYGAQPFRPAHTVGPQEARCKNCWAFEKPAKAMTIDGLNKTDLNARKLDLLQSYLSEAGLCTLNPPVTGPRAVGLQPITHPSGRCSAFMHVTVGQRRAAQMAAGIDPDQDDPDPVRQPRDAGPAAR